MIQSFVDNFGDENMKGTMNIELIGENIGDNIKHSGIKTGLLKLPEDCFIETETETETDIIAVGENENYLHCFSVNNGRYFGIFKSDDKDHIYHHLLKLNT